MSWAERSTGISPTTTDSCFAHMFGRVDSIDADIARIDEQIEARLAPFVVEDDPEHQVLIAEDLGASRAPLVLAQVECYTRRSAASRHSSRWRSAAANM